VLETPAIRIEARAVEGELERAAREIGSYSLVCVTSPNGAALLMDAVAATGGDARRFGGVTVAAIGPGTAAELERRGIRADMVASPSTAEGLLEALAATPVEGRRVLIARASEARDALPDGLRDRGAQVDVAALYDTVAEPLGDKAIEHVDVVALYDTVAEPLGDKALESLQGADFVTFTSSSTVRFFMDALGGRGLPNGARVVSIGPITSATARELGLEVHTEAARHDIDGLVAALLGAA
jgi:uroporphyrinogen III methyltransferase/synthase